MVTIQKNGTSSSFTGLTFKTAKLRPERRKPDKTISFFLNRNIKNKNQRAKMPNIFGTEIEEVYYYEIV